MDVRRAALKCLLKIIEQNKFYDEALEVYAGKVTNPSELTNTVAGAIKFKLTLDYFIENISSKKIKKLSPVVRNILRLGIFELEYLKRPEYAVVNSYVELSRQYGGNANSPAFVNAVLRNFIRKRKDISLEEKGLTASEFISIKYSHPEWLIIRWLKVYGREETEKICEYNNKPPKINLRVNTLKTTKNKLLELFNEHNINCEESLFSENCLIIKDCEGTKSIKNIPGYNQGYWAVQGESSVLVSEILNPEQ
ncbi:MAG: hypothetical protein KAQ92_05030, partial [Candidatus Aenigmarchaeota archaeon]|nr:hypothetical protein [Candidatus Aenigmarchaeota archaeon]